VNQALKTLLEGEGFQQMRPNSCEFAKRHEQSDTKAYVFRVWLHRAGGQAEVCNDDDGSRVAREPSWRTMGDLHQFFREFQ
jgi:hypothetical protein